VLEGIVFGFLGSNGAGKTTRIKMLTTVLAPSRGRLSIAGHDPVAEPMLVRRTLGIVGQVPGLDDGLTAAENMELQGVLSGAFAFGVATNVVVLGGLSALLLAIGAWLFSRMRCRAGRVAKLAASPVPHQRRLFRAAIPPLPHD
jgi:ABC-type transport system involved in cytochrome c biogenesis ATPase subunit